MKKASIILSAAGLVFASSAQATILTDSFSNALQTTEIAQTGTLDKFDSSLGTLNSVTLTLSGESISATVLENTSANNQLFSFISELNFIYDASSVGATIPLPAFTTTLGTTGGLVNLAAGASLDLGTTTDNGSFALTLTDAAALAAFLGTGTFDVNCSTLSSSAFTGGGGNINNVQNTTAACNGNISYDYEGTTPPPTGVPAPTALSLLGIGLLGLASMRRRKTS